MMTYFLLHYTIKNNNNKGTNFIEKALIYLISHKDIAYINPILVRESFAVNIN